MAFYWSGFSLHSFCFYARVFLPLAGVSLSKPTRSLPRAFAHSRIMMSRYSNKGDKRGGRGILRGSGRIGTWILGHGLRLWTFSQLSRDSERNGRFQIHISRIDSTKSSWSIVVFIA